MEALNHQYQFRSADRCPRALGEKQSGTVDLGHGTDMLPLRPSDRHQGRRDLQGVLLPLNLICRVFDIELRELLSRRRHGPDVCRARRVAMYLLHVVDQHRGAVIAGVFRRDQSTVTHALHKTELEREDPDMDGLLDALTFGMASAQRHLTQLDHTNS